MSGTENYIKVLVECLSECVDLDGRNISMDRLYTSVSIANWLLTKNITCVGTLQTRRVGIPEEIRSTKDREEYSSKVFLEKEKGDLSITSYVVPSSKGKKNVLVLSTMRPLQGITKDDGKKSQRF